MYTVEPNQKDHGETFCIINEAREVVAIAHNEAGARKLANIYEGPKPETEPVQIEGHPTVQNVLCIIDLSPDQLPVEYTQFIDDAYCIAFRDASDELQENIYSDYGIDVKLSEEPHAPIVAETHLKIRALMAVNDAAYFRLVY